MIRQPPPRQLPGSPVSAFGSPETLVLYRKRASTKEAYQDTVVQRAFDKAV